MGLKRYASFTVISLLTIDLIGNKTVKMPSEPYIASALGDFSRFLKATHSKGFNYFQLSLLSHADYQDAAWSELGKTRSRSGNRLLH
jgi:hypothetical protein